MKCTSAIMFALILCGCSSFLARPEKAAFGRLEPFQLKEKFGFKDEPGKIVIEPIYDDAHGFAFGLAPVNIGAKLDYSYLPAMRHGGRWGYVNAEGKIVVPPTLQWAMEFSDGLAQVADDKGRRFIDTEGKTVITLGEVSHAGNFREGLAPVYIDRSLQKQGWHTRFINKKGDTVFTVDGYAEEFHEGFAALIVRGEPEPENPKYGFIDRTGKVVIVPQFAEAFDFHEGLAGVRTKKTTGWYYKGDTWGYIDKTGKYVLEPKYNETHPFCNGVARVHVGGTLHEYDVHSPAGWEGGEWQLIDRKGNILKRNKEWVEYKDAANKPDAGDGK